MNKNKHKKLESKGWKVGTVQEFLHLSPEETAYIELKLTLAKNLQKRRRAAQRTVRCNRLLCGLDPIGRGNAKHKVAQQPGYQ